MLKFDYNTKYLERIKERPSARKHVFVPHTKIIEVTSNAIARAGMTLGKISIGMTHDKMDMVCSFDITKSEYIVFDNDETLWVGIVNGNSGHRASRIYGGASRELETLVMYQDKNLGKRYAGFKLKKTIDEQMELLAAVSLEFPRKVAKLKSKELSETKVDRVFSRAAKKGMVSWTKLKRLHEENNRIRGNARFANAYGVCQAFAAMLTHKPAITHNPRSDVVQQMYEFYKLVAGRES